MSKSSSRGSVLIISLAFVVMFTVIFAALTGIVSRTYHESVLQSQDETAFQIAEAGLNYARWRLAHAPDNLSSESKTLTDQFAGDLGTYDLTFTNPTAGSTVVLITSVGRTVNQPSREVTLEARYGQPSLAQYASITNEDVWHGGDVSGRIHSNGGIRMDGTSDSLVESAQNTYPCQPYHGCSSPFEIKDGVWGSGVIQELWDYPVPAIDFNAITNDLLEIKSEAQTTDTYYGDSGALGYWLEFYDNNTYAIYQVNSLQPTIRSCMYEPNWSCKWLSHDINTTTLLETKAVPSGGAIFTEDTLWVSGDIRDRVTVAAGVFPDTPGTNVDVIINGNISYDNVYDGSRTFGAVAQRHVLIPYWAAPNDLKLDGAYVAQRGSFHRRYYYYGPNVLRNSLTRNGMLASDGVPGTSWVCSGEVCSGYQTKSSHYDPNLRYGPPPYFPVSDQFEFISWDERQ